MRSFNPRPAPGIAPLRALTRIAGFTLVEAAIAIAIVAIGFLGAFGTVLRAGKMVSAGEEEALVMSGLEERMDQLRLLKWPALTDGTGITSTVWTARPQATAGITVSEETFTISPCDVPGTQTLQATWDDGSSPTLTFSAGTPLNAASAVKVVGTLTWTGRRSAQPQTRAIITVISKGGISKK
jgi:Tfp pilus assembly protein PilV